MSRSPREAERIIRLRGAVTEAVRCWVSDDVTVVEAVERATPEHVSRSMRADVEWMTEHTVEHVEERVESDDEIDSIEQLRERVDGSEGQR